MTIISLAPDTEYTAAVKAKSISGDVSPTVTVKFDTGASGGPTVSGANAAVDDQTVTVTFSYEDCDTFSVSLTPNGGQALITGTCDATGTGSVTFEGMPTQTYTATVTVTSGDEQDTDTADFEVSSIDG